MIVWIRDENDSDGAVQLGVSRFVIERCMRREIFAVENAVFIKFLRFVTKDDDDFVFYVDSLVVVVLKLRGRNSVSRKDHAAGSTC